MGQSEIEQGLGHYDSIELKLKEGIPIAEGIPGGNIVLFLAKINDQKGYCIIYGPTETCLPENGFHAELWDAKIAIGNTGGQLKPQKVRHGHKYVNGGGMVQFGEDCYIFFRSPGDKNSTYKEDMFDEPTPIEKVFTVL